MMGAKEEIMKFGRDHYLQEIQKFKFCGKKAAKLKHTNSGSWMRNSEHGHRRSNLFLAMKKLLSKFQLGPLSDTRDCKMHRTSMKHLIYYDFLTVPRIHAKLSFLESLQMLFLSLQWLLPRYSHSYTSFPSLI